MERVLRIYHATCRNLTIVNDNLSRNQATIEVTTNHSPLSLSLSLSLSPQKVNSHLKRAGQDLEKINVTMEMTSEAMCNFAPTLRMDVPLTRRQASVPQTAADSANSQTPQNS